MEYLKTDRSSVVNISCAADSCFRPEVIVNTDEQAFRARFTLHKPYIMYTGGIDYRKNIDNLIKAYAKLPLILRQSYQLAIVTSIQLVERERLAILAKKLGLSSNEIIFTGFVSEEDLVCLYNLCALFIFPSLHEGFGLPALEAMACGRAVISSNTSSLPEVIGYPDALFDPYDVDAIANKLQQVLTDATLKKNLEQHSTQQAKQFSWEKTAIFAVTALIDCYKEHYPTKPITLSDQKNKKRLKLAYISPLPPERTGIAMYSAELLPELAKTYDIELIVDQAEVDFSLINMDMIQRSVEWFCHNAQSYDRVLYHFGNSQYHQHMFDLLEKIPGIVVLHDFFLSSIIAHMEFNFVELVWIKALYESHGYHALYHRVTTQDLAEVIMAYPCNASVLQNAEGIIVHSNFSCNLAEQWYGDKAFMNWRRIPLLRVPFETSQTNKKSARARLGLSEDSFIVCSFGLLGKTKLNHRLLNVWPDSMLARDPRAQLVLVGENSLSEYGVMLSEIIYKNKSCIKITGWVDTEQYNAYLQASDIAVQLRTLTRGETSAAVLDCMNYGVATIVNAHGSIQDLPEHVVYKIADEFTDAELVDALNRLYQDSILRHDMGIRAQEYIRCEHAPQICGKHYVEVIESFYHNINASNSKRLISLLMQGIATLPCPLKRVDLSKAAQAIDLTIKQSCFQKQLFVDISEIIACQNRWTGIQRVVRSVLKEWLFNPPNGYRVEPVYARPNSLGYFYARQFTLDFMGINVLELNDDPISFRNGDYFIGLDLSHRIHIPHTNFYQMMRAEGVRVQFVVYDLLPVIFPEYFTEGANKLHQQWLTTVTNCDGAICISQSVAQDLISWCNENKKKCAVNWFHIGADLTGSIRSLGIPKNTQQIFKQLSLRNTFVMVGTLEPRKGHQQVLDAFDILWSNGIDVNLVVLGKQGWMVDSLIQLIKKHPEKNKRLFWLDNASDEYLEKIYSISTAQIVASYAEGFGLPLIEAAWYKLPVIARDIPVFREVAGEHAHYFNASTAQELAQSISGWLDLYKNNQHPSSEKMPWLTWSQSATDLFECVIS
jgi:glycosyltransferase involved in cell wall biosynthesis